MILPQETSQNLHQFLVNGSFVDACLVCQGVQVSVHKIVLCSYSSVFRTVLGAQCQEQLGGGYEIKDSHISCVLAMIQYMYTGSYNTSPEYPAAEMMDESMDESTDDLMDESTDDLMDESTDDSTIAAQGTLEIAFHARVVSLADRFRIRTLRDLSLENFRHAVESELDADSLLRSVASVYDIDTETSDELHRILVTHCADQLVGQVSELGKLLEKISTVSPRFAADLLQAKLS